MPRPAIALDIETVGHEWEMLAPEVRAYLLERERDESRRAEVPQRLALHPGTGRVIMIGVWYIDEERGRVLVEGAPAEWAALDDRAQMLQGTEDAILREFWGLVREVGTIVTFNGRSFDGPYLMIRSAILGVEPSRNLVPYRYSFQEHCDLVDVLSFWGARTASGTLDFWCRQFGIPSPKEEVRGAAVGDLFRDERLRDLARYCLGDARATAQLYLRLRPIVKVLDARG
ncbi:MAG TPA: ribonuclease H-like domain-containing protein [bacterium]|nr:ribonuclease H-like domain-containing protein [bacterium]